VTDAALFLGSRVGGHHDAAAHALRPQDIGAVVELPHRATFRAAELPFCRQVQKTKEDRGVCCSSSRIVYSAWLRNTPKKGQDDDEDRPGLLLSRCVYWGLVAVVLMLMLSACLLSGAVPGPGTIAD